MYIYDCLPPLPSCVPLSNMCAVFFLLCVTLSVDEAMKRNEKLTSANANQEATIVSLKKVCDECQQYLWVTFNHFNMPEILSVDLQTANSNNYMTKLFISPHCTCQYNDQPTAHSFIHSFIILFNSFIKYSYVITANFNL